MRHELFIDNKKVDLSPNTNINLTYKSNLLSELDKITSSYSYTIKLPKTKRNMELIEGCNIPSNNSSFAYLPHRARLLRDGIEIVRDAVVVLLSVGDDIQISLTWGNVSALADFIKSGKKLSDLNLGVVEWNYNRAGIEYQPSYNAHDASRTIPSPPVIFNKDIFNRIASENGIDIELPSISIWNRLVVPCLNAIIEPGVIDGAQKETKVALYNTAAQTISMSLVSGSANDDYIEMIGGSSYAPYTSFKIKNVNYSLFVKGSLEMLITFNSQSTARGENYYITDSKNQYKIEPSKVEILSTRQIRYTFNLNNEMSGKLYRLEACSLSIAIDSGGLQSAYSSVQTTGNLSLEPAITSLYTIVPRQNIPLKYDLAKNAPDMTQIDYMKGIMSMLGLYVEPKGDRGVRIVPYSTLTDNIPNALDWSDKVINKRSEASDIEYRMSGMAQKLIFQYKENEVGNTAWGALYVDDKTLQYEKTVLTLPFAPCQTNTYGTVYIPIYSVQLSDEYYELDDISINSVTPRITELSNDRLSVFWLSYGTLLSNYWGAYANLIRRPKILKEQVKLNAIDLKNIDMTIPVYISQYGSYFAIIEIKTKKDDICDVQLLKI